MCIFELFSYQEYIIYNIQDSQVTANTKNQLVMVWFT